MCNNIVRNKLGDKLSTLTAMVENQLNVKYDLEYLVRESSDCNSQDCWIEGLIDGHCRVGFFFGENLEVDNGVHLTIFREGGENPTTRTHKLDKSLEEQTDEVIRTIASDICQMVEEYYIEANKLRDNLSVLADMLKCSLRAKYRHVRVKKLKCKDSSRNRIDCTIGDSMHVPIDYYTSSEVSECTGHEISEVSPYVGWWILLKDAVYMGHYELSGSLDEQDESTIRAIADSICRAVSECYTEDNK